MPATTAPDPGKHIIVAAAAAFDNVTWHAVVAPGTAGQYMYRSFSVNNNDGANSFGLCTDGLGTNVITIPANGQYLVKLSDQMDHRSGFTSGDIVCYIKGSGSAPVAAWVR